MSLRAEIHDALDAELPLAPELKNKVATLIRDDRRERRALVYRGSRRRLRVPLYLVAAALIVVLIAGLIVGGRYLRDLNAQTQIDPAKLHALEKTPIRLPKLQTDAICPITASGNGPVQIAFRGIYSASASGANWWRAELVYDATAPGVVLIRAVDINATPSAAGPKGTGAPVWFALVPGVPSAIKPVGAVAETDVAPGGHLDWYPEAAFIGPIKGGERLEFLYLLGIGDQGNCVGWQFDGPGFSENIVTS